MAKKAKADKPEQADDGLSLWHRQCSECYHFHAYQPSCPECNYQYSTMIEGYHGNYDFVGDDDETETPALLLDPITGAMSIPQAAFFIAKCLLYDGKITIRSRTNENLFEKDDTLHSKLSKYIAQYTALLLSLIQTGKLEPESIRCKIDGTVVPENTYILIERALPFLEERGIQLGTWYNEHCGAEASLHDIAKEAIKAERGIREAEKLTGMRRDSVSFNNEAGLLLSEKSAETQKLTEELKRVSTSSAVTRKMKTLQRLVIGMAADKFHYNPENIQNSAISNIKSALDRQGISLDEDTIRAHLKESSEFLRHGDR